MVLVLLEYYLLPCAYREAAVVAVPPGKSSQLCTYSALVVYLLATVDRQSRFCAAVPARLSEADQ